VEGGESPPPNDLATATTLNLAYRAMLLLASGLQMAGPDLTPQTFAAGLGKAQFPNPATELRMGAVGFPGGVHGMTQDATEFWWSIQDQGPYVNQGPSGGTLCYVNHGARILPGAWPATPVDGSANDPYFREPCDSGLNDHP
jgi:hypothetical protein